jgi:hypothetical protein
MGIYTEAVQKLYVAYFSRPADPAGLAYWEGVVTAAKGSTAAVSAAFAASAEYKAAYAGLTETQVVNTIYNNLFGRDAEPAGLLYWAAALQAKTITVDNMVATIANAAQTTDASAYANKVAAATAFTMAVDTTAEILGYNGPSANAAAKTFLKGITTTATLDAALVPAAMDAAVAAVTAPIPVEVNVSLTTGVDNIVGSSNNENIAATATTLTGLDKIDGGLGTDTLIVSDVTGGTVNLSLATVKNVESLQYTSTLGIGNGGTADVSAWTGLTTATFALAGTGVATITAADTTDVTVSNSGNAQVTVTGGDDVSVTTGNGGSSAVSITGNGVHTAWVKGGTTVNVSDNGKGTLSKVTLDSNTSSATIAGDKLATLSITNTSQATTVSAAGGTRALAVTIDKLTGGAALTDATATSIALTTANNDSTLALSAAAATAVTIAGNKALTLALTGGAVTSITSSSTGDVTLSNALGNGVAYTGLGGVDTLSVGATTKAVKTGAGNDVITITAAALGTGGTVDAGDGTGDTLVMSALNAATATSGTAFAAAISGFEKVSLGAVATSNTNTIDLANLDNINYVQIAGAAAGTASNPGTGESTAVTVVGTASDADTVTFDGTLIQLADGDDASAAAAKIAAGAYANYTVTAAGAVLTVVNKTVGNAVDLTAPAFTFADGPATGKPALPAVAVTVQGVTGVAAVAATSEVQNQTVVGPATGPVSYLGVQVAGTNIGSTAAAVVAAIVADSTNIIATWNAANPTRELLSIAAGAGTSLDLTYAITEGDVAPMAGSVSNGIGFGNASTPTPGNLETTLVNAVAEQFTATFTTAANGADTVAFDGTTIVLADGDNAAAIATKVNAGVYANWTTSVAGGVVTFTNKATGVKTDAVAADFTITDVTTGTGTQSVTVGAITQGTAPTVGTAGALILSNLASGGTLEINGAGTYTVGIKDAASGTNDTANLVVKANAGFDTGVVTVANVENIVITTTDGESSSGTANTDLMTLVATSAKSIVVTGNGGLNLTNTGNTKVTSFDASGVTLFGSGSTAAKEAAAAVTFTSTNTTSTAAVSIKGGAGADMLTGNAGTDTINGGAGDDTINGGAGQDFLTGGAGKDLFIQSTPSASGVSYDTITDLSAGDIVRLVTINNVDAAPTVAGNQLGAMVTGLDAATAVFQDFLDASANKAAGVVSWFQFGGNTYIVQDNAAGSPTFQNGVDNAIKLTGLIDLTNSTFLGTDLTVV